MGRRLKLEDLLDRLEHLTDSKPPVCLHALGQPLVNKLHSEGHLLWKAGAVIALTPHIREYLEKNDPKALGQLLRALGAGEEVK